MPDTPITQAGLDRLEANLRTLIEATKTHVLTLRDADRLHIEQRFKDSGTAVDAALNAAKEAVLKAEGAAEKRFEGVNEFRQTLADQQRTLIPRTEAEQRMAELARRIQELETANATKSAETEGSKNLWGYIVGALGAAAILYSMFGRP